MSPDALNNPSHSPAASIAVERRSSNPQLKSGSPMSEAKPPSAERLSGRVATPPATEGCSIATCSVERVRRVQLLKMARIEEGRGTLSFGELGRHLPFVPKRYFIVYDVATNEVRGEHAHKHLQQLLLCISGSVSVAVDDGMRTGDVVLDRPDVGLYIPPCIWGRQYNYTRDAILLVLASDLYRGEDYIQDYKEFERYIGRSGGR